MGRRSLVISVSGKGGSGKTTIAALLLKAILTNHDGRDVLMIDADPSTNLPDVLGVELRKTVGDVANELKRKMERGILPTTVDKSSLLETWVYQTLVESDEFDLLAMGRTEGEGCYCYVNSVLSRILDVLVDNYDVIIMDMEAGLEHLSRRTDHDVDLLLIVTDPSKMGLNTAKRIKEVAEEVHVRIGKEFLIGNLFREEMTDYLEEYADEIGVELAGIVPHDPKILEFNMLGRPLLEVPDRSPAVVAIENIARRIGLI